MVDKPPRSIFPSRLKPSKDLFLVFLNLEKLCNLGLENRFCKLRKCMKTRKVKFFEEIPLKSIESLKRENISFPLSWAELGFFLQKLEEGDHSSSWMTSKGCKEYLHSLTRFVDNTKQCQNYFQFSKRNFGQFKFFFNSKITFYQNTEKTF